MTAFCLVATFRDSYLCTRARILHKKTFTTGPRERRRPLTHCTYTWEENGPRLMPAVCATAPGCWCTREMPSNARVPRRWGYIFELDRPWNRGQGAEWTWMPLKGCSGRNGAWVGLTGTESQHGGLILTKTGGLVTWLGSLTGAQSPQSLHCSPWTDPAILPLWA